MGKIWYDMGLKAGILWGPNKMLTGHKLGDTTGVMEADMTVILT